MSKKIRIALAGNPNSGRSSLFNELTGGKQEVGNWAGVSVEISKGFWEKAGGQCEILDLPGIYSLFPHLPEQIDAIECLKSLAVGDENEANIIVNVVDATNLERSLYLTTQLLEIGLPVIVALNMSDELQKKDYRVDEDALSALLGLPCIKIAANKRRGFEALWQKVCEMAQASPLIDHNRIFAQFDPDILQEAERIEQVVSERDSSGRLRPRWVAQQVLEGHWHERLEQVLPGHDTELWEERVSRERYRVINGIVSQVLTRDPLARRRDVTQKLDALLCHRVLALPFFFLIMAAVFAVSFGPPGRFLMAKVQAIFTVWLPGLASAALSALSAPDWLDSLVIDGVLAGAGGLLVFLPQLAVLFFFLVLLEDSGYIARAAFITDRFLSRFGLGGRSFIPLLLGFGCSVPAIMAARSLDNRRERLLTMFVTPFMSCSARLPVYGLLTMAFFASRQGLVVLGLYVAGILAALLTLMIANKLAKKQPRAPFIMEMPPYRLPVWHCVWKRLWIRVWDFIYKAGTFIVLASIIVWLLSHFDWSLRFVAAGGENILSVLGRHIAPLFAPLGFGEWQTSVALFTGLFSKEAVVATISVLYAEAGNMEMLAEVLQSVLTPLSALSFLVFVLLYTPCVATVATLYRESKSLLFTLSSVIYQFIFAWVAAFAVYRIGLLLSAT
ncbi:MAG: ferrous iron transport protein B [Clostridiales bacterium]|nr:ferrous iron transport protein B [Clostridiales bacterium]